MMMKTCAALILATSLLASSAQAFVENRPVPITQEGVQQFGEAIPKGGVIDRGMMKAVNNCQGCPVPGIEASVAAVGYLHGLFDYYGYDYGATLRDYLALWIGEGRDAVDPQLNTVMTWTGLHNFMVAGAELIEVEKGQRLVDADILTPEQLAEIQGFYGR